MEGKELSQTVSTNVFSDAASFEHAQRVAKFFSQSDLVPDAFKGKIGNCLIALEMSTRMGASPIMVMQNMNIIHGKPSWSSPFLIACVNQSGKFSPLRYETSDANGGSCRAYATDNAGDVCKGPWVSMEMAKAEGWSTKKGSKWLTMPELMMRYRAAAFFQRQFAPEISMGFHTVEEVRDITPRDENGNTEVVIMLPDLKEKLESAESLEALVSVFNENEAMIKKDFNLLRLYGQLKGEYEDGK